MISRLKGIVADIGSTYAVIDLHGFGIKALASPNTLSELRAGSEADLFTSLVVREDSLTLYAFGSSAERDAFELVQSTSGIGPKIAQAVISVMSPEQLSQAILNEDINALCKVPGIGKKGAQRMILDLKDKVKALGFESAPSQSVTPSAMTGADWEIQVCSGLESLGWSARDAQTAAARVAHLVEEDPNIALATLMRAALRTLAK